MKRKEMYYDKTGKEEVFWFYDFEQCVMRMDSNAICWIKFKGGKEYKPAQDGKLVAAIQMERDYITKAEYDNW